MTLLQAIGNGNGRRAAGGGIIAAQHAGRIRQRSGQRDLRAGLERQDAVILEQHDALFRRAQRQRLVIGRADGARRGRVGPAGRQARQVAIAVSRGKEPDEGGIDVGHADMAPRQRFLVSIAQVGAPAQRRVVAFAVDPVAQGDCDAGGGVGRIFVMLVNIDHRVAVGHDIAPEAPGAAQIILKQHIAAAGRLPVDAVVRAHDRPGLALDNGGPEGGQICILQIVRRGEDVVGVAAGFRTAMDREMLGRRDHERQVRIVPLHALDKGDADPRCQIGIFAIGFLTPAPARIAEDVDVGRPAVEAGADPSEMSGLPPQCVQRADLCPDGGGDLMDQRRVEGSGEADRLREIGRGHRADRPVKGFGPPIIGGYAEPRNGRRDVQKLRDLLVQRQLVDNRPRLAVGLRTNVAGLGMGHGGCGKAR